MMIYDAILWNLRIMVMFDCVSFRRLKMIEVPFGRTTDPMKSWEKLCPMVPRKSWVHCCHLWIWVVGFCQINHRLILALSHPIQLINISPIYKLVLYCSLTDFTAQQAQPPIPGLTEVEKHVSTVVESRWGGWWDTDAGVPAIIRDPQVMNAVSVYFTFVLLIFVIGIYNLQNLQMANVW